MAADRDTGDAAAVVLAVDSVVDKNLSISAASTEGATKSPLGQVLILRENTRSMQMRRGDTFKHRWWLSIESPPSSSMRVKV